MNTTTIFRALSRSSKNNVSSFIPFGMGEKKLLDTELPETTPQIVSASEFGVSKDDRKLIKKEGRYFAKAKLPEMNLQRSRHIWQSRIVIKSCPHEGLSYSNMSRPDYFLEKVYEEMPMTQAVVEKAFSKIIAIAMESNGLETNNTYFFQASTGFIIYRLKNHYVLPHRDDAYGLHGFFTVSSCGYLSEIELYNNGLCPAGNSYQYIQPDRVIPDGKLYILEPFGPYGVHAVSMRAFNSHPWRLVCFLGLKGYLKEEN